MRDSVIPAQQIPMTLKPPIINGLRPRRSMVKHWRKNKRCNVDVHNRHFLFVL